MAKPHMVVERLFGGLQQLFPAHTLLHRFDDLKVAFQYETYWTEIQDPAESRSSL